MTVARAKYVHGEIGSGRVIKAMNGASHHQFSSEQRNQRFWKTSVAAVKRIRLNMDQTVFGTLKRLALTVEKPSLFIEIWK